MATQLVTFKIDKKLLKQVDDVVKQNNYQNRTELIRKALRENVDEEKLKKTMAEIDKIRGSWRKGKQTTDKELHEIREKVAEEFYKRLK